MVCQGALSNHCFHPLKKHPATISLNLPPLWTLAFIGLSWGLSQLRPILTISHGADSFVGLCLAAFALATILWTAFTLRHHRTTFIPHRQASHLVTAGPFRFSRHPIYLADLILLLASGFLMGSAWPFLFTPFLALILRQIFMIPEERMLQKTFPEEFHQWSSSVRRWF